MTEKNRFTALVILGVLAVAGLACTTYLLATGAPAEAALAVLGVGSTCAGAIGGALTFTGGD